MEKKSKSSRDATLTIEKLKNPYLERIERIRNIIAERDPDPADSFKTVAPEIIERTQGEYRELLLDLAEGAAKKNPWMPRSLMDCSWTLVSTNPVAIRVPEEYRIYTSLIFETTKEMIKTVGRQESDSVLRFFVNAETIGEIPLDYAGHVLNNMKTIAKNKVNEALRYYANAQQTLARMPKDYRPIVLGTTAKILETITKANTKNVEIAVNYSIRVVDLFDKLSQQYIGPAFQTIDKLAEDQDQYEAIPEFMEKIVGLVKEVPGKYIDLAFSTIDKLAGNKYEDIPGFMQKIPAAIKSLDTTKEYDVDQILIRCIDDLTTAASVAGMIDMNKHNEEFTNSEYGKLYLARVKIPGVNDGELFINC